MAAATVAPALAVRDGYRPCVHFTPPANWMNDPNGLVKVGNDWHLFFQYNPTATEWGNIHWGHAVSSDLFHWSHLPPAIAPDLDGLGHVFSGSAVDDTENTSGFGTADNSPLVAVFTHSSLTGHQVQSVAYSLDKGWSWHLHERNPVLGNPGVVDFRDPKLVWHQPTGRWIMALAVGDRISFYNSPNLLEWTHLQDFGAEYGVHGGVWECPDLFPIEAEDGTGLQWILIVSVINGAPNGGSGTFYFVGQFDGTRFTVDDPGRYGIEQVPWLDYGPDSYAGVTWSGTGTTVGSHRFIAWMSNWRYARQTPTALWRGAMTLPRELRLVREAGGYFLRSLPAPEIDSLQGPAVAFSGGVSAVGDGLQLPQLPEGTGAYTLAIEFAWDLGRQPERFGLRFQNEAGEWVLVSVDPALGRVELDRTSFGPTEFRGTSHMLYRSRQSRLALRLVVDSCSMEVFVNAGEACLTALLFPTKPLRPACVFSIGRSLDVVAGSVSLLRGSMA